VRLVKPPFVVWRLVQSNSIRCANSAIADTRFRSDISRCCCVLPNCVRLALTPLSVEIKKIRDPIRSRLHNQEPHSSTYLLAQTFLRNSLGLHALATILSDVKLVENRAVAMLNTCKSHYVGCAKVWAIFTFKFEAVENDIILTKRYENLILGYMKSRFSEFSLSF